jgi:hypothetical protein
MTSFSRYAASSIAGLLSGVSMIFFMVPIRNVLFYSLAVISVAVILS